MGDKILVGDVKEDTYILSHDMCFVFYIEKVLGPLPTTEKKISFSYADSSIALGEADYDRESDGDAWKTIDGDWLAPCTTFANGELVDRSLIKVRCPLEDSGKDKFVMVVRSLGASSFICTVKKGDELPTDVAYRG